MTLLKHHIDKHNHFVRMKGHGLVSTLANEYASPHVWKMAGHGMHHHHHHHSHAEHTGCGTVSHKHEEISGGEIHVRNGRHHKEKLHKKYESSIH